MSVIKPKPGKLFVVCSDSMYISGGTLETDINVPVGSAVMFLESETYEQALEEAGFMFDDMDEYERHFDRQASFWKMLYSDHVLHLPEVDAKAFLEPAPKKRKKSTA